MNLKQAMHVSDPSIQFDSGLVIGYDSPLAEFRDGFRLGGGTHFLLARNGRGKTTLLRTLAQSLKPVAGSFAARGFMQYLPENLQFDPWLTPSLIFRTLLAKDRFEAAMDLAGRIELETGKVYGRLSTGNRRKTHLIMAEFAVRPDSGNILLLDEPFSGLDAFARHAFEEIWHGSAANVLRLVSCHPDYDSMSMPSAVLIEGKEVRWLQGGGQTWNQLKEFLN